ncbi:nucleotide exchange factor GrpE [Streptosporangium sp. NBC_01755]|uniref:nucleotide exchange factor GrpE n=1 Tax=unclassified Streptosporangium TaxID=2632669 RepID=UPI002DD9BD8F|nr:MULTISPECIES: nucleotide exchange factor GrpE [unclassified Streptosporangium]WSA28903.1 nucleotide exchange factor GrpE [Streptosporangium sp. NBC_01810]WSC99650.1 nucleotide exchange factor GrpE [Streptosporangium sp. NBC_01755]
MSEAAGHGGQNRHGGQEEHGGREAHGKEPHGREAREQGARGKDAHGQKAHGKEAHGKEVHGEAGAAPADLQARVDELQALVTDLQDRWRRALADLDNLRKRVSRDTGRVRDEERARAAGEWLPVLDNLDRALEHAETDPASIVDGMRAIRDQAQEVLSRLGYPRRDEVGTAFDPARHEAVAVLPQEGVPDGTVLQVVRPGYGDGEQQLRPALVVVAKGA